MRITTKRIKVISMTVEEHKKFIDCVVAAKEGHTSHYAEAKLADGSYLGVSVLTEEEERELQEQQAHDNNERAKARYANSKSRHNNY